MLQCSIRHSASRGPSLPVGSTGSDRALSIWAQHREFRAVFAELTRHTDRELNDMGIDRSDITRIAYQEAERRIVTPAASSATTTSGHSLEPVPAE